MNEIIISYAFSILNDRNNGKSIFEIFCQKLISQIIDHNFMPASGSDAGGDGGIDGWSLLGKNDRIKYAFSIDKKSKTKIEAEIKKTNFDNYIKICFFTNQPIAQRTKEDIYKKHHEKDILIYDLENLVNFVSKNNELGKYIDLPAINASVTIDYLQNHNQLIEDKEIISQYIPRTIKIKDEKKEWQEIALLEYSSNLPLFTVLQAPAGYGKTCSLQQLHQKILEKKVDILLPPVFISLSDYLPNTLLQMIKVGMAENGDYQCNNFLLLLDGYDEVKEVDRPFLLKEVSQLLKNNSWSRKVIITVRENTYNYDDFKEFRELSITMLSQITREDIKSLLAIESISFEKEDEFFENTFFKEFSDNIFYVVKFIDYYKANKAIAGSVTELFTFIINQEIKRLFRGKQPDINSLEALALYMTLNQKLSIDDVSIADQFVLKLPMIPFRFSHKSIQEYLAARVIVKQTTSIMKEILAKGNLIIPYLTNTLGFVLNILSMEENQQDMFINFVNWCLEGKGNAKRLLQIESDKITPSMNQDIFKAVIEQESKIGSAFDIPESLVPFGLQGWSKKENLNFLIDSIISFINTNDFHYHTIVLQTISYQHLDLLGESNQEKLLQFFLKLLEPENFDKNLEFVDSLLYSVSYFPVANKIYQKNIENIVTQLLSAERNEGIVNNLCQLLFISGIKISIEMYYRIYDCIMHNVIMERGQMAHFVPTQTSDDTYFDPIRVTYWTSFIPLTKNMLGEEPYLIWGIIEHTIEIPEIIEEWHSSSTSSDLDELFGTYFDIILQEIVDHGVNDYKFNLIIDWIISESKAFAESKLWKRICESSIKIDLFEIAKTVILKTNHHYAYIEIIDYFINIYLCSVENFDRFRNEFYLDGNESLKSFFQSCCFHLNDKHPMFIYAFSCLPGSMKESIETRKLKHMELIRRDEEEKEKSLKSYHIAFNTAELAEEVMGIFNDVGEDIISKNTFWEYYHQDSFSIRNKFALYLFQSAYWGEKENVNKEQMLILLEDSKWKMHFMTFLVQYNMRNQINFSDFTEKEKQATIAWAKLILDEYPLSGIESPLMKVHMTLSIVLRNCEFLIDDKQFQDFYSSKVLGLTFSAFPNVVNGVIAVRYESYSLDYLEQYCQPKMIIEFIYNNFGSSFSNYMKAISVCGYITSQIKNILPYQKKKMKEEIANYIEANLCNSYYLEIINCAFALGFKITELDIQKLSDAFILDKNNLDLAHNTAYNFLRNNLYEKTEEEIQHLSKALFEKYSVCSDDFLKKTIAEYYIIHNPEAGELFEFFAEYILQDDSHTILNQLIRSGSYTPLKTADIQHLEIVNKLFLYSREKSSKSERRNGILAIALSSYKAMADKVQNRDELDKILDSMNSFAEEYDFLYIQIQEIENSYAERTYQPISIESILSLVGIAV